MRLFPEPRKMSSRISTGRLEYSIVLSTNGRGFMVG
jgi:hypothetical protein